MTLAIANATTVNDAPRRRGTRDAGTDRCCGKQRTQQQAADPGVGADVHAGRILGIEEGDHQPNDITEATTQQMMIDR